MRSGVLTLSCPIFLLIALSCPVSVAAAPIPRETIDRLVEINVEQAEIRQLNAIGKLTDREYSTRKKALDNEQAALWQPYRLMATSTPAETGDIRAGEAAIAGLSRAKLSLLEPRWRKEEEVYREAQGKQRDGMFRDIEKNAQQAAHLQKQRQSLQAQLEKGAIDRAAFAAKDKEALAAIEALRNKHDPTGRPGLYFDERLTAHTQHIDDPPPAPQKPVAQRQPPLVTYRPPQHETDYTLLYWLAGGALVIGFLWLIGRTKEQPEVAPPLTDIHGSAQWAAYQENPADPHVLENGVFFGKSSRPGYSAKAYGAPIASLPEAHTLIVARTRAGKGTRVIVPTLLRYRHSILVIDPKGENAAITARTRRDQLKQAVHIVNPWGEMQDIYTTLGFTTATFNPLDAIERNDPNAVAVAQSLAATICPITDAKQTYWQGSAANVLTGVLLWITDRPEEQKTLARARELVTQSRQDFKTILARMMTSTAFSGAIREMVSQYIDLAPETYSSIMSTLAEATKFLSDPQIKASTAGSSFSLNRLRDELITVYLVIPHDRIQTHSTWLRLVISSVMQAIKARNRIRKRPAHRCMFLIDEFGSIGHVADVPRDIALMAGYGLDFTLIVQGLDQLKHHYGEAKGTILTNCAYQWYCFVNELETAKHLSESLGKKTVRTVGKGKSTTATAQGVTEGESTTYGETGRALLNPDEILTLGRGAAILLNPLTNPHYLTPVDYWKLTATFANLEKTHPHLYWKPPITFDPNPYYNPPPPPLNPSGGPGEEVFPAYPKPPKAPPFDFMAELEKLKTLGKVPGTPSQPGLPKTPPPKPPGPPQSPPANPQPIWDQIFRPAKEWFKPLKPSKPKESKPEKNRWPPHPYGDFTFDNPDNPDPPAPPKPPDPENPGGGNRKK